MTNRLCKVLFGTALSLAHVEGRVFNGRDLIEKDAAPVRHSANTSPLELNVDAKATYNDKFMALMKSPCRPEFDGFFGATYGAPIKIKYGFKLETMPLSPIMDMLDFIEDKIVDSILVTSFPQLCGFRRRELRELSRASGFRFLKFEEVEKCTPELSQIDFCGIFTGQVNVFGKDRDDAALEVLSMLDQILNPSSPARLHPELLAISSEDDYLEITGGDIHPSSEISALGWAGICLCIVIFTAGIWWFCFRNEKQGDTAFSNNAKRNKRTWNKIFKHQSDRHVDYNPEEKSIKPSYEPEAVAFGGGETMLLTDGRPVEIDFDPTSYSDASLDPRATQRIV